MLSDSERSIGVAGETSLEGSASEALWRASSDAALPIASPTEPEGSLRKPQGHRRATPPPRRREGTARIIRQREAGRGRSAWESIGSDFWWGSRLQRRLAL